MKEKSYFETREINCIKRLGEILKELTPQKTSGAMKQKSNQPGLQGQRKNQNGMPPGMNGGPR